MENKLKISVIIPVYNTEQYLRTCLDSLLIQDFKNIEYILIDDGSTDSSLEICNEYKLKDNRFQVYHKENGGPSSARNLALSKARGEYITFVDSDDYIEPGTYTKLNNILTSQNPDIIVFGGTPFPRNTPQWIWDLLSTRDVIYEKFEPKFIFDEVGTRPFLWLQLVKKDIIIKNNLQFDESMDLGEDQLFQILYFMYSSKVVFTSEKLYHYRVFREGSLMNKYASNIANKLNKHIDLVDKLFKRVLSVNNSNELRLKLFTWSIFFIWSDIINLLVIEQIKCAKRIVNVWEKYRCNKIIDKLDIWGQSRYKQIILMSENGEDLHQKIINYRKQITLLENEISELKNIPKIKKLLNRKERKNNIKKIFYNLKHFGLKNTLKKILVKLNKK